MNQKLITLSFAGWILFLSILFLLGSLDQDGSEGNPSRLSERVLSQYQETLTTESQMESRMESQMESPIQAQWQSVRRGWNQFSRFIDSMRDVMHQPAPVSQRAISFEKDVSREDTRNVRQKITMLSAQWEALGTSIPAMED